MQGLLLQTPCIGQRLRKNNYQCVVGVQFGGNVIIMAWRQIPPYWRVQRGEKEWPPPRQHGANNNDNKRCNYDSVALVLSFLLPLCPPQHCAAVSVGIDLVLLPSSHWHLCLPYAGIVALVMLAYLPLLHWCHHPCCTGVFAILALALLPSLHWLLKVAEVER
jgi:hypothetical protein